MKNLGPAMKILGIKISIERKKIVNLKAQLARDFSMKNLSPAKKMLGMRINKEKKTVEAVISTVHTEGAEEV